LSPPLPLPHSFGRLYHRLTHDLSMSTTSSHVHTPEHSSPPTGRLERRRSISIC
jgi:hypothetical protein